MMCYTQTQGALEQYVVQYSIKLPALPCFHLILTDKNYLSPF
jgi:hypothetical protein